MSFVTTAKDTMLNALSITQISAHTGFPGTTGASEVTGGSYARVNVTFGTSSGGVRLLTSAANVSVPAGTTVRWMGLWNGATFIGYSPNAGSPLEFIADIDTDTITSTGHGFVNTNKVVFYADTVPGGLVEGAIYYVINATANTFQVAATSGGALIDLTSAAGSACVVSGITEQAYATADTHTISSWTLALPD